MNKRLDEIIMQNFARASIEPCLWWHGAWWSRGALEELVLACEENLVRSGFRAGARVALLLPNSPLFLASAIAAWRLGGAVAPVDPHFESAAMLEYLRHIDVMGAITHNAALRDHLVENGIPCANAPLDDAMPMFEPRDFTPDENAEAAALFHTSGTTGTAKAVPITHKNILSDISACVSLVDDLDEDDVMLNALPNFHTLGFMIGAIMPLVYGMSQVVLPSFLPAEASIEAMKASRTTVMVAVPTMLSLMLGAFARGMKPPLSLRLIFSGGDFLLPELAARAERVFGFPVLEGYGLTETSPVLSVNPSADRIKPGTCGRILPCFEFEVRDEEGAVLPRSTEGHLWVRGDAVASSYYRMPELTAERFVDGWFDTRDVVKIDEDGYLTMMSRLSDIIVVSGLKVYPREVEKVLMTHPAVADVAVVGAPNAISGEIVKAFLVLKEGERVTAREIASFCRKRLNSYKVPRMIRFIDAIPRTSIGSTIAHELKGKK